MNSGFGSKRQAEAPAGVKVLRLILEGRSVSTGVAS